MRYKVLFSILYTVSVTFCGLLFIGFDLFHRSTGIFLAPLATWVLVIGAVVLTTRLDDFRNRIFFVVGLFTHYIITFALVYNRVSEAFQSNESNLRQHWENQPNTVVFTIALYCTGQLLIWIPFFKAMRRPQRD
jgi:uncharacterized membrane protein